jgi:hypothetical protein
MLSTSLWLVWTFSGCVGLWQALVHHVGPHQLVTTYFLCGAQAGETALAEMLEVR